MIASIIFGTLVFIAGMFVGASILMATALRFSKSAQSKPATTFSAVGVGGHAISMDAYHARMLESVLKHYQGEA